MNQPESDDNQELNLLLLEKRRRNGSPESDDIEEMGYLGFVEKRQRTVSPPVSDDDTITVVKDFLAEFNQNQNQNQGQENVIMEVMRSLQEEEELICPNNFTYFPFISSFLSVPPFSSSSFLTINGNTESCGSSFSDLNSTLMASIDIGFQSIIACLMWDSDVLKDLSVKISSALDCLVLKTMENCYGGFGSGSRSSLSASSEIEQWILSLKKGVSRTMENGFDSSFDFNPWVVGFNGEKKTFETEQNVEAEAEEEQHDDNSGDLDHGSLSLSDSSIKSDQNSQGEEEDDETSSGCLSLSDSSMKTEQNGEEDEEETEESSGCLSLIEPNMKTGGEEESIYKINGYGGNIEKETVDEWIERVMKEMPIPFEFEFEMEI